MRVRLRLLRLLIVISLQDLHKLAVVDGIEKIQQVYNTRTVYFSVSVLLNRVRTFRKT
jgi:hypothetical protein